ncbi:MAG TPA: hypothetical protein VK814_07690 [Acidobacteriaceae bacterium]|jgi:hypothetical protein|nr:hypothetical protein [Acidobacteriaceae bacterium]
MKISESTSYPHPVLAPWSTDISGAIFETKINYREELQSNQLSIHCQVTIDQPDILALIQNGSAIFGCFIRCQETGFRRLQRIGFPTGTHDFARGALLGRVQIRPIIWTIESISAYNPVGAHPEFSKAGGVDGGQILALGEEQIITVTRPPLPAIESIFEIRSSRDIPDGQFSIDAERNRITVTMDEATYRLVQELRQSNDDTRAVIMNALYSPILMEVLEQLGKRGYEPFEQYRWLHPFRARCELTNVDIKKLDKLNDAQKLLSRPFASLRRLIQSEGEQI